MTSQANSRRLWDASPSGPRQYTPMAYSPAASPVPPATSSMGASIPVVVNQTATPSATPTPSVPVSVNTSLLPAHLRLPDSEASGSRASTPRSGTPRRASETASVSSTAFSQCLNFVKGELQPYYNRGGITRDEFAGITKQVMQGMVVGQSQPLESRSEADWKTEALRRVADALDELRPPETSIPGLAAAAAALLSANRGNVPSSPAGPAPIPQPAVITTTSLTTTAPNNDSLLLDGLSLASLRSSPERQRQPSPTAPATTLTTTVTTLSVPDEPGSPPRVISAVTTAPGPGDPSSEVQQLGATVCHLLKEKRRLEDEVLAAQSEVKSAHHQMQDLRHRLHFEAQGTQEAVRALEESRRAQHRLALQLQQLPALQEALEAAHKENLQLQLRLKSVDQMRHQLDSLHRDHGRLLAEVQEKPELQAQIMSLQREVFRLEGLAKESTEQRARADQLEQALRHLEAQLQQQAQKVEEMQQSERDRFRGFEEALAVERASAAQANAARETETAAIHEAAQKQIAALRAEMESSEERHRSQLATAERELAQLQALQHQTRAKAEEAANLAEQSSAERRRAEALLEEERHARRSDSRVLQQQASEHVSQVLRDAEARYAQQAQMQEERRVREAREEVQQEQARVLEAVIDEWREKTERQSSRHSDEVTRLRREHQEEVAQLRKTSMQSLSELEASQQRLVQELERQYTRERAEQQSKHNTAAIELEAKYSKTVDELQAIVAKQGGELERRQAEWDAKLTRLNADYEARLSELQAKHTTVLADMESKLSRAQDDADGRNARAIQDATAAHHIATQEQEAKHARVLADTTARHRQQMEDILGKQQLEIAQLADRHHREMQERETRHERETKEWEARMRRLEERTEKQLRDVEERHANAMKETEERHNRAIEEKRLACKELEEKNDRFVRDITERADRQLRDAEEKHRRDVEERLSAAREAEQRLQRKLIDVEEAHAVAMRAAEDKAAANIRELEERSTKSYRELAAKQAEKQRSSEERHSAALRELEERLFTERQSSEQRLAAALRELQDRHRTELEGAEAAHRQQWADLSAAATAYRQTAEERAAMHAHMVRQLQEEHAKRERDLELRAEADREELIERHALHLTALEEKYERERADLRRDRDEAQRRLQLLEVTTQARITEMDELRRRNRVLEKLTPSPLSLQSEPRQDSTKHSVHEELADQTVSVTSDEKPSSLNESSLSRTYSQETPVSPVPPYSLIPPPAARYQPQPQPPDQVSLAEPAKQQSALGPLSVSTPRSGRPAPYGLPTTTRSAIPGATPRRWEHILAGCCLLGALTPRELTRLAEGCTEEFYQTGDLIVRRQEPADSIFILTRGTAQVIGHDNRGVPFLIGTAEPGHVVLEAEFANSGPSEADVVCTTPCAALRIGRTTFSAALDGCSTYNLLARPTQDIASFGHCRRMRYVSRLLSRWLRVLDALQNSALFFNMNAAELAASCCAMQCCRFQQGDLLLQFGDDGEWLYFITSGQVELVACDNRGRPIKVCEFGPQHCVGEVEFTNAERGVGDVRAVTDVTAVGINRICFERCVGRTAFEIYNRSSRSTPLSPRIGASISSFSSPRLFTSSRSADDLLARLSDCTVVMKEALELAQTALRQYPDTPDIALRALSVLAVTAVTEAQQAQLIKSGVIGSLVQHLLRATNPKATLLALLALDSVLQTKEARIAAVSERVPEALLRVAENSNSVDALVLALDTLSTLYSTVNATNQGSQLSSHDAERLVRLLQCSEDSHTAGRAIICLAELALYPHIRLTIQQTGVVGAVLRKVADSGGDDALLFAAVQLLAFLATVAEGQVTIKGRGCCEAVLSALLDCGLPARWAIELLLFFIDVRALEVPGKSTAPPPLPPHPASPQRPAGPPVGSQRNGKIVLNTQPMPTSVLRVTDPLPIPAEDAPVQTPAPTEQPVQPLASQPQPQPETKPVLRIPFPVASGKALFPPPNPATIGLGVDAYFVDHAED